MQIPRFVGEFGYLNKKKKEKSNGDHIVFGNMLLLPSASKDKELARGSKILLLRSNLVVGTSSRRVRRGSDSLSLISLSANQSESPRG